MIFRSANRRTLALATRSAGRTNGRSHGQSCERNERHRPASSCPPGTRGCSINRLSRKAFPVPLTQTCPIFPTANCHHTPAAHRRLLPPSGMRRQLRPHWWCCRALRPRRAAACIWAQVLAACCCWRRWVGCCFPRIWKMHRGQRPTRHRPCLLNPMPHRRRPLPERFHPILTRRPRGPSRPPRRHGSTAPRRQWRRATPLRHPPLATDSSMT